MSRLSKQPSSIISVDGAADLRKSQTQPVFSVNVFSASERTSQSCPDVLFDALASSDAGKKKNPHYIIDFYPNREWMYKDSVTRVAGRLLSHSREDLIKKFSADRLSKTDLLNEMVGVREINWVEQRETQFKIIRTDAGSLLWKEVEPVEKLLPFEKLLYRSFDFRRAALIMQDYCNKLGENYSLQESIDVLSEKLLMRGIILQSHKEAQLFFHDGSVKKMLSVFESFDLFAVLITKELWQLLCVLQNRDSLIPDNLKMLLSLSPNLYHRVIAEIMNVPQEVSRICLSTLVRKINLIDRSTSPLVLSVSSSVSSQKPASPSTHSNESPQFLTVKTMTLFPRTSNASPLRANSKSPKTSYFSSPLHT